MIGARLSSRRLCRLFAVLSVLVLLAVVPGCSDQTAGPSSGPLVGTTWRDEDPVVPGTQIFVVFETSTECRIGSLAGRGAPAQYTIDGDEVTIYAPSVTYVFELDGKKLKGAGVVLTKQ